MPTPDDALLARELELMLIQLRILNYRREIGLIELHQRNRDGTSTPTRSAASAAACSR